MTTINPEALPECNAEAIKLRDTLTEKWIPVEHFIKLIDVNRDGDIDRDELLDGLSQFGLADLIDVNKLFTGFLEEEIDGTTSVKASTIAEMLKSSGEDIPNTKKISDEKKTNGDLRQSNVWDDFGQTTLLVALVAHNNLKPSMMQFVKKNLRFFQKVSLVTTGSTGRALSALGLDVDTLVSSGPLGGDQEIGGLISQGKVAAVFFFTDPLSCHPHAADIEALNRICCVHDTMFANNPSTAEALVYSLEHSAFGYSRLTGHNPIAQKDSLIVKNYKANQAKVISSVQKKELPKRGSLSRRDSSKGSILHVDSNVQQKSSGSENAEVNKSSSNKKVGPTLSKSSVSFSSQCTTITNSTSDTSASFRNDDSTSSYASSITFDTKKMQEQSTKFAVAKDEDEERVEKGNKLLNKFKKLFGSKQRKKHNKFVQSFPQ